MLSVIIIEKVRESTVITIMKTYEQPWHGNGLRYAIIYAASSKEMVSLR